MSPETPVQTVLLCSQCGRSLAPSDLVHIAGSWVCADCKPAFLSRVMASGTSGVLAFRYGGFWIRFGARILDGLIVGVPYMIFAFLLMPTLLRPATRTPPGAPPSAAFFAAFAAFSLTSILVGFITGGCYEVLMLKYKSATLGKMACGIKVVRPDGRNLSWGVCFGRFFMWNIVTAGIPYLNAILMTVSSIMLGVDDEKRALHDRVCDTRVIFNRA